MATDRGASSFDELAIGLSSGSILRGKALKLMGAALLGSTLASLGIGGVAGADPPGCKRNGEPCTRDKQCCSGDCSRRGICVGRVGGCAQPLESCTTDADCCFGACRGSGENRRCRF
jgi:hypothetical protein